ncbi:MAG: MFS transporter [Candidatus Bathyarchaeia archaeon]
MMSLPLKRDTSYGWVVVGVSFALFFMASGAQMSFPVSLMPISRDLGWSVPSLSQAMSICMLATGLSMPIVGKMTDKYGPRRVILLGNAVVGVSAFLLAFVSSLWQVYLLYGFMLGFTWQSVNIIATTALISRWFAEKKSLPLSISQSAYPIGWFCIVPLAGAIILNYGWRNAWLLLGIVLILIVFSSAFLLKYPEKTITKVSDSNKSWEIISMKTAVKTRFFIIAGMIVKFLCGFTDLPLSQLWVPISLEWGINEVAASQALGYMAAVIFIGTIAIGPLPAKIGYKMSFSLFYIVRAISFAVPILLIKSELAYYAFMILLGISFFGMSPIFSAWVGEIFGDKYIGGLVGLSLFIHFIGAALGVYVFSLINITFKNYYPVYLLSLTLTLLTVFFCHMIKPPEKLK